MSGRPLRIAVTGLVHEHAGSVASASYVVLKELLDRGVEIDLYAHEAFLPEPQGLMVPGFRYIGLRQPKALDPFDHMPHKVAIAVKQPFAPIIASAWARRYLRVATEEHRRRPYSAVLALGLWPAFTLPGVGTVTWLQGPVGSELAAIRGARGQLTRAGKRWLYVAAHLYYGLRGRRERRLLRSSGTIVVPSDWSRRTVIAEGARAQDVHAVPYPIDLNAFQPSPEVVADLERPTLLHLGRLDPRKRLDLLLDAFAIVCRAVPESRLSVVGRPGIAGGQLDLIEASPVRDRIAYSPAVPREQVVPLLRSAAVLVQTSENENFGSAVAEALACGTPVVAGPTNGTADYLDQSSETFAAYEPESVATAILAALDRRRSDPAGVASGAREHACATFSPTAVVDRLLPILEAAADRAPAEGLD